MINLIQAFSSWFGTSLAGTLSVWKMFSIPQACMVFSLIILTVWNVPQGLKFAAFYVGGVSGATSPILYSWLNTQMRDAPESRAFSESRLNREDGQNSAVILHFHSYWLDDDSWLCRSNLGSASYLSDGASALLSERLSFQPRFPLGHVGSFHLRVLLLAQVGLTEFASDASTDPSVVTARSNATKRDVETSSEQEVEGVDPETPSSGSPLPSKGEELTKELDNYPAYVVEKR